MYFQNYVFGLLYYYFMVFTLPLKQMYMQSHKFFGFSSLILALAAVLSGMTEQNGGCFFQPTSPDYNPAKNYHNLLPGCRLLNATSIVTICSVFCTLFAVLLLNPEPAQASNIANNTIKSQNSVELGVDIEMLDRK